MLVFKRASVMKCMKGVECSFTSCLNFSIVTFSIEFKWIACFIIGIMKGAALLESAGEHTVIGLFNSDGTYKISKYVIIYK